MESKTPLTLNDIAPREDDGLDDMPGEAEVDTPPVPRRRARTQPTRNPAVDIGALVIEDVPIAKKRTKGAGFPSKWPALLERLAVGQSVFVAGRTSAKLGYVRKIGKKMGLSIAVMDDMVDGIVGVRIGRTPDTGTNDDGLGDGL